MSTLAYTKALEEEEVDNTQTDTDSSANPTNGNNNDSEVNANDKTSVTTDVTQTTNNAVASPQPVKGLTSYSQTFSNGTSSSNSSAQTMPVEVDDKVFEKDKVLQRLQNGESLRDIYDKNNPKPDPKELDDIKRKAKRARNLYTLKSVFELMHDFIVAPSAAPVVKRDFSIQNEKLKKETADAVKKYEDKLAQYKAGANAADNADYNILLNRIGQIQDKFGSKTTQTSNSATQSESLTHSRPYVGTGNNTKRSSSRVNIFSPNKKGNYTDENGIFKLAVTPDIERLPFMEKVPRMGGTKFINISPKVAEEYSLNARRLILGDSDTNPNATGMQIVKAMAKASNGQFDEDDIIEIVTNLKQGNSKQEDAFNALLLSATLTQKPLLDLLYNIGEKNGEGVGFHFDDNGMLEWDDFDPNDYLID